MIKAVIFDLYGTLIEIEDKRRPYKRFFEEIGEISEEVGRIVLTERAGFSQLAGRIRPERKIDLKPYYAGVKKELNSVKPYPETFDVLKRLRGLVSVGLISNVAFPYISPFFNLKLNEFILPYLFSCEVGMKKPDPEIYRKMIRSLGIRPREILMVGDNIECDVIGPRNAGMSAVLLDREGKTNFSPKINSLEGVFNCIIFNQNTWDHRE